MELVSHKLSSKHNEPALIMPIGDIQWSGRDAEVAMGMLKRHVQWGVDNGAYFLGMGDYIDFMSPSNQAKFKSAGFYDATVQSVDDKAHSLMEDLFKQALSPSKGRWLGLLEGHHFHEYKTGITTDMELAEMLDAPFLGTSAFVRLVFNRSKTSVGNVVIWCHHGNGSGKSLGAPLNKLEQMMGSHDADIYLIAHHHKKVAGPVDRIVPVWGQGNSQPSLTHRTKIIACTGGFLKGCVAGSRQGKIPRGGYVEKGMMNPVALGGILVKVRPRWDKSAGWMPDINVEL